MCIERSWCSVIFHCQEIWQSSSTKWLPSNNIVIKVADSQSHCFQKIIIVSLKLSVCQIWYFKCSEVENQCLKLKRNIHHFISNMVVILELIIQELCAGYINIFSSNQVMTRKCYKTTLIPTTPNSNCNSQRVWLLHPPGSKSWHSEAVRPSLAELAIPSTYWGREGDLDIEYSLVFQKMSY